MRMDCYRMPCVARTKNYVTQPAGVVSISSHQPLFLCLINRARGGVGVCVCA